MFSDEFNREMLHTQKTNPNVLGGYTGDFEILVEALLKADTTICEDKFTLHSMLTLLTE